MHLKVSSDNDALNLSKLLNDGNWMVLYYAEWCGHCKTAAPEFAKLLAASPIDLSGRKAAVRMLDADQDKDAMAPYKDRIKGFPTILIQKGSDLIEYPGERKSDDVIAFAKGL